MSEIVEGLGAGAMGSLFARALEPDSGAKAPHPDQPKQCLNCGATLDGAYCSACGQQAHLHRTIGGFMHDLLHGALHFEGKLWHTLPMLVFKPGELTRRYIDGQRARFVSPMALFLFGVFLMFAVFQMVGLTTPTDIAPDARSKAAFEQAVVDARQKAETAQEQFEAIPEDAAGKERARQEMEAARARSETMAKAEQFAGLGSVPVASYRSGVAWLDKAIEKWTANPGLMLYKLQANSYKFSWLLIPLSIPFVWLLFAWKRRFKAYDHAIFVTYSLSFMTLLFVALSLFTLVPSLGWLAMLVMLIVPPIHLYKQLRHAYALSRLSALWRLLLLSLSIWIVILIFLQLLLLLGAF